MTLLIVVIATGVLGACVQHYLPKLMTKLVPMETIYEEIPRIRQQLQAEAEQLVSLVSGGTTTGRTSGFVWGARPARSEQSQVIEMEAEALDRFREVYNGTIRPFLVDPDGVKNACSSYEESTALFASLRMHVPESVHHLLADLENICEEERQLKRQKMMYRGLHAWLLVHVPLSLAFILLGGIHAVVALGY